MKLTAEQIRQAAKNTAEKPRNAAPAVQQAIETEKQGTMQAAYMDALRRLYGGAR